MTDTLLPYIELASALEACLSLPDTPELLDPQLLRRAHELLDILKTTLPDATNFAQMSLITETVHAGVQRRYAELHHEQNTLTSLISKNREVADQLEQSLRADQYLSQEAWNSFDIARKLIARQGGILLTHLDSIQVERLVAKNLNEMLKSPTTSALTQAMHSLIREASTLFEGFERQNRQIMSVVEAVYTRFNQLPGFTLGPPQLSSLENYRQDLEQLGEKTAEFCRRPINLMTDKASLAKKFGMEVVVPLRDLFTQLKTETDWWLRELSIPIQEQIQVKKVALEKCEEDVSMIRDQITTLEARKEETEIALSRLHQQEAAVERIMALTQTFPFEKPAQ
ncbi:hypothetical protein SCD_n00067 [Sulfuricella denitrificans skB26]|uniref:GTPase n=1 Tax=Sulfuricella denitrificans (strain DSM 22764 / NBRC 105220 / skB26) TaxID=1163617 RepID=S6ADZ6_SULDS|nr:hypothetical protein [Sulfuricella denitrificans]BAN33916.1 hypothetical protein SCD_n00067 [Sulfuricella denitrificans skB26]